MGIGVSIFLLALGAILAFAVEFDISGLDVNVVGYILMACGLVGLLLALMALNRHRAGATGVVSEERVVRDRDVY